MKQEIRPDTKPDPSEPSLVAKGVIRYGVQYRTMYLHTDKYSKVPPTLSGVLPIV